MSQDYCPEQTNEEPRGGWPELSQPWTLEEEGSVDERERGITNQLEGALAELQDIHKALIEVIGSITLMERKRLTYAKPHDKLKEQVRRLQDTVNQL